jgi:hypothetical protein
LVDIGQWEIKAAREILERHDPSPSIRILAWASIKDLPIVSRQYNIITGIRSDYDIVLNLKTKIGGKMPRSW